MKTHLIYGRGPDKEIHFNVEINEETDCKKCIHNKICSHAVQERCANFEFGNSPDTGCLACNHRFTRWDEDPVPCFSCRDFSDGKVRCTCGNEIESPMCVLCLREMIK